MVLCWCEALIHPLPPASSQGGCGPVCAHMQPIGVHPPEMGFVGSGCAHSITETRKAETPPAHPLCPLPASLSAASPQLSNAPMNSDALPPFSDRSAGTTMAVPTIIQ